MYALDQQNASGSDLAESNQENKTKITEFYYFGPYCISLLYTKVLSIQSTEYPKSFLAFLPNVSYNYRTILLILVGGNIKVQN